mmetsp:Transcript_24916/g.57614  ORF Transcript_24916/g.57614 Transcript_24916/m.57614 type:complete len:1051 (-) Transcript_24916:59-3211(-)
MARRESTTRRDAAYVAQRAQALRAESEKRLHERTQAAVVIQQLVRSHIAQQEMSRRRAAAARKQRALAAGERKKNEENAVTALQAATRGLNARQDIARRKQAAEVAEAERARRKASVSRANSPGSVPFERDPFRHSSLSQASFDERPATGRRTQDEATAISPARRASDAASPTADAAAAGHDEQRRRAGRAAKQKESGTAQGNKVLELLSVELEQARMRIGDLETQRENAESAGAQNAAELRAALVDARRATRGGAEHSLTAARERRAEKAHLERERSRDSSRIAQSEAERARALRRVAVLERKLADAESSAAGRLASISSDAATERVRERDLEARHARAQARRARDATTHARARAGGATYTAAGHRLYARRDSGATSSKLEGSSFADTDTGVDSAEWESEGKSETADEEDDERSPQQMFTAEAAAAASAAKRALAAEVRRGVRARADAVEAAEEADAARTELAELRAELERVRSLADAAIAERDAALDQSDTSATALRAQLQHARAALVEAETERADHRLTSAQREASLSLIGQRREENIRERARAKVAALEAALNAEAARTDSISSELHSAHAARSAALRRLEGHVEEARSRANDSSALAAARAAAADARRSSDGEDAALEQARRVAYRDYYRRRDSETMSVDESEGERQHLEARFGRLEPHYENAERTTSLGVESDATGDEAEEESNSVEALALVRMARARAANAYVRQPHSPGLDAAVQATLPHFKERDSDETDDRESLLKGRSKGNSNGRRSNTRARPLIPERSVTSTADSSRRRSPQKPLHRPTGNPLNDDQMSYLAPGTTDWEASLRERAEADQLEARDAERGWGKRHPSEQEAWRNPLAHTNAQLAPSWRAMRFSQWPAEERERVQQREQRRRSYDRSRADGGEPWEVSSLASQPSQPVTTARRSRSVTDRRLGSAPAAPPIAARAGAPATPAGSNNPVAIARGRAASAGRTMARGKVLHRPAPLVEEATPAAEEGAGWGAGLLQSALGKLSAVAAFTGGREFATRRREFSEGLTVSTSPPAQKSSRANANKVIIIFTCIYT